MRACVHASVCVHACRPACVHCTSARTTRSFGGIDTKPTLLPSGLLLLPLSSLLASRRKLALVVRASAASIPSAPSVAAPSASWAIIAFSFSFCSAENKTSKCQSKDRVATTHPCNVPPCMRGSMRTQCPQIRTCLDLVAASSQRLKSVARASSLGQACAST